MFCKTAIIILTLSLYLASAVRNKIYFIENENFSNYNSANQQCKKIGMNLLSIKTRDEFDYLKEYIKKEYKRIYPYWLGAYRINNQYEWTGSVEKIEQFFWHEGEPNDKSGNENCIHTWEEDFDWNDNDCEVKLPFICDLEV